MDYYILSRHRWKGVGDKDIHLAVGVAAFIHKEFDIRMTQEQAMIFMKTPEAEMLHLAAEKKMLANA